MSISNYSVPYSMTADELMEYERECAILAEEAQYDGGPEIKPLKNYPGYEVSSYGDVISLLGKEEKSLKPCATNHGHLYVSVIDKNGKKSKKLVHRLVAETFLDNPNNHPLVRHLDDDPTHNEVDNLAWGTKQENYADMIRNGHDVCRKPVYCYETDTVYESGADAAYKLGVTRAGIVHACKGIDAHVGGYHVCYLEDKDYKINHLDEWLRERQFKPVHARNLDTGETLYFKSVNEASSYLGIPACGISSTLHGHTKHTHRWYFWED